MAWQNVKFEIISSVSAKGLHPEVDVCTLLSMCVLYELQYYELWLLFHLQFSTNCDCGCICVSFYFHHYLEFFLQFLIFQKQETLDKAC